MHFTKHLLELKWRFFYILLSTSIAFFISYIFSKELIYLVTSPLLEIQQVDSSVVDKERFFIFTNMTEAFYTYHSFWIRNYIFCGTFMPSSIMAIYFTWTLPK